MIRPNQSLSEAFEEFAGRKYYRFPESQPYKYDIDIQGITIFLTNDEQA